MAFYPEYTNASSIPVDASGSIIMSVTGPRYSESQLSMFRQIALDHAIEFTKNRDASLDGVLASARLFYNFLKDGI